MAFIYGNGLGVRSNVNLISFSLNRNEQKKKQDALIAGFLIKQANLSL
jgi:hypothetical protein